MNEEPERPSCDWLPSTQNPELNSPAARAVNAPLLPGELVIVLSRGQPAGGRERAARRREYDVMTDSFPERARLPGQCVLLRAAHTLIRQRSLQPRRFIPSFATFIL